MSAADGGGHARLTIDLSAAAANYNKIRKMTGAAEVAAVVKADGYGLGAIKLAAVFLAEGCRSFFVATPEEGFALRAGLPSDSTIYVLHGFAGGDPAMLGAAGLTPVLSTPEDVARARAYGSGRSEPLRAALHFDTGMNRLGLEAGANGPDLTGIAPVLVMSHLAAPDEPDHPLNARQRARFEALRARFPGVRASLAGSAGILLGPRYHLDLVRPGIALYGGNPAPGGTNPFSAVVRLQAPILQRRNVPAGETIGYGGTFETRRESLIATLGLGYADGYLRALGNRAEAALAGRRVPVVGRISMDLITLDVTDIPLPESEPGRYVELFGESITLDEVARNAGTAHYEILTRLGQRLHRLYLPAVKGTGRS